MTPDEHIKSCWTLDRKVPLAFLLVMLLHLCGSVWWAADISARVSSVESEQARYERLMEKMTVIETDVKWIKGALKDE